LSRGAARETSARLAPYYREVAAQAGAAFLDAGALVTTDPVDGVHLDAAAHGVLGVAIAEAIDRLLSGPASGPLAQAR